MTDAIQKAREALEAVKQLTVGDRCPNWNTIAAVTQSRFAIANICDAALAALDAETPVTPADVGELVERLLWVRIGNERLKRMNLNREGIEELATALERVVRDRDALVLSTGEHITRRSELLARAESAEAKLAEARKVIETCVPDYETWMDDMPDEGRSYLYKPMTVGDLRAARRFLEETKR